MSKTLGYLAGSSRCTFQALHTLAEESSADDASESTKTTKTRAHSSGNKSTVGAMFLTMLTAASDMVAGEARVVNSPLLDLYKGGWRSPRVQAHGQMG